MNLVLTGVAALCVLETLVISWLLSQRANGKRVEASLHERLKCAARELEKAEGVVRESQAAKEALTSLGGRLLEAQEQERSYIARELHDDISQRLALLSIELQQLAFDLPPEMRVRSEALFKHIADISEDVQALSHQLHSSKLEYLGIVAAMKGFCVEFAAQQQDVTIDFTSAGVPADLPRTVSVCLFRVLQEALRNAVKHSGATHVEARLLGTSASVVLTIRDRGRGFDPEIAMHGRGLGLISMRERAGLVNGIVTITSKPAWGTEISVHVPVEARAGTGRKRPAAAKNLARLGLWLFAQTVAALVEV